MYKEQYYFIVLGAGGFYVQREAREKMKRTKVVEHKISFKVQPFPALN
jgi:hypothetical protein